ncbi:DUF4254 domain-containing protein [Flavobacteriales bacterium]|nr:DUF4254 domain-containing protein [Flavobacteriales bacterium]
MNATTCFELFNEAIDTYHVTDNVDTPLSNPHNGVEGLFYHKCWIDAVQWHLEDIIRDPNINPVEALVIKRRIDKSNQDRTDMVEKVDDWFWDYFGTKNDLSCGKLNTESPAWVVDRLSILALKIYHMQEQVDRTDADAAHTAKVQEKLNVLLEQKEDLSLAFNQLIDDVMEGRKYMKVYRQMKMYNDESLNPVLYKK